MMQKRYADFLRNFRADSVFKYRELLIQHHRRGELTITVELSELGLFDGALLTSLQKSPEDQLDLFEAAANDVLRRAVLSNTPCNRSIGVQIALKSTQLATPLRLLAADHVGKLIKVSGIIVSSSKVKSKAARIEIQCSRCGKRDSLDCRGTFSTASLPIKCNNVSQTDCGSTPYVILPDDCSYVEMF